MTEYVYFTEEEKYFLVKLGYTVHGHMSWKENKPQINKTDSKLYPYRVGVEGVARDVDGDLGWCRTWSLVKTLEEAIKIN